MSHFDEAKIRRASDGKFANKDAQRESQGQVDLGLDEIEPHEGSCHDCGGDMFTDEYGVTTHLDETGNEDWEANADHVAVDDSQFESVTSGADFGSLPGNRRYSEVDKKERLQEIQSDLQESIDQIVQEGKLGEYLDAMATSRMPRWSFNNRLLAHMQLHGVRANLPDDDPHKNAPPMMMSPAAWKREYGAFPKKGTKAMWILAPSTRTFTEEDENGKEVKKTFITGFRPQAEFDISQVQGENLPDLSFATDLPEVPEGEAPPGVRTGLRHRIESSGYAYSEEEISGSDPAKGVGTLGYTDPLNKKVVIDSRCNPAQKVSVMAHELAHIKHGHVGKEGDTPEETKKALSEYRQHRGRMETEAEATAYMTTRALGVSKEQSGSFSASYIAGWSKGDGEVVAKSLNASTKVFNDILDGDWPEEDD